MVAMDRADSTGIADQAPNELHLWPGGMTLPSDCPQEAAVPTSSPLRVVIVEAQPRLSFVARALNLQPGVVVVGEASDLEAARLATELLQPDAVVLNVDLDEARGFEAIPKIRRAAPGCIIIAITAIADPLTLAEALWWGADTCLDAQTSLDQLGPALTNLVAYYGSQSSC